MFKQTRRRGFGGSGKGLAMARQIFSVHSFPPHRIFATKFVFSLLAPGKDKIISHQPCHASSVVLLFVAYLTICDDGDNRAETNDTMALKQRRQRLRELKMTPWIRFCGVAAHRLSRWSGVATRHVVRWSGVVARRVLRWSSVVAHRVYSRVKREMMPWVRSLTERRRRRVGVVPVVLLFGAIYSFWNTAIVSRRLLHYAIAPVDRPVVTKNGERVIPRSIYINGYPNPQPLRDPEGTILVSKQVLREWQRIEDDESYVFTYEKENPMPDICIPNASLENHSYPNCNMIHELDMPAKTLTGELHYVASGGSNDVFRVFNTDDQDLVLKKFSPGRRHHAGIPHTKEYFNFHYDIVRRDALVMERLTKSPHVLSLHGHCGFAVAVPWADGGTFGNALEQINSEGDTSWHNMSSAERMKYALDAAKGLADVHDIDVVHGDLTVNQYLVGNGTLQLGDFNRGILLRKNSTDSNNSFCRLLLCWNRSVRCLTVAFSTICSMVCSDRSTEANSKLVLSFMICSFLRTG